MAPRSANAAGRPARSQRAPETSARRAEIRATAAEVFARMGFAHATMRDIADAAGIIAGSLYHHFASKDDLLLEIMERFNDDILRDMHEVLHDENDALVRITNLIHLALRYIVERPDESRILNNDAHYIASSAALAPIAEGAREAEAIWIAALRKGVKTGALRPEIEPKVAYATIMGAVFSALRWYQPSGRISPKKFTDHVSDQLLRGIVAAR